MKGKGARWWRGRRGEREGEGDRGKRGIMNSQGGGGQ